MLFSMRETLPDDAAFVRGLFHLPHVRAYLNTVTTQVILDTLDDPNAESYIIEDEGQPAGNFVMRTHGFLVHFETLVLQQQRCGGGSFALRWALRRAFDELCTHRTFLEVRADNSVSRHLCERFGFKQEGVYRDGFRDERTGQFHDLCAYGLLEHDYRIAEKLATRRFIIT
jgi:RimJ/RimL family protein N-acetyltransferase